MIFLKLGGSLITEKSGHETPRLDVMQRLAREIAEVYQTLPGFRLLLGHGSGSFGHRAAQHFGTHEGAQSKKDWLGFSEVGAAANRLHQMVLDSLRQAGLPVLSFPPSSTLLTTDGQISSIATAPITMSLDYNLLPVVYGDVALDTQRGASIVSTEQVLAKLADHLQPRRFLLAGKEAGILNADGVLLQTLGPGELDGSHFHDPEGADVTGGMRAKVDEALRLSSRFQDMEVLIFGAEEPGVLKEVLLGGRAGTHILPK